MAVLNKLNEACAKRDMDGVLECYAPDTDLVVLGTGADEKNIGIDQLKAQAKRDYLQSEAAYMEFG